jgi:protein-export membrane protein SecD
MIVVLVIIAGVYVLAAVLTKDHWAGGTEESTRVAFSPPPDSDASPDALARARDVLAARVAARGADDARVAVDGDTVTVSAPDTDTELQRWRDLGAAGQLNLRPVVNVIAAQPSGTPLPTPPKAIDPQRISDEKELRQSTDQSIQLLALQFQASRCGDEDVLAGRDDPKLPLITCSRDRKEVYLLDPALIDRTQIAEARSGFDEQAGQWIVDLQFDNDADQRWKDFTGSHIGTRVAFVVDTVVVSAPEIMEAIPGGRTQITGRFTAEDARDLAATLDGDTLPFPLTPRHRRSKPLPLKTIRHCGGSG